MTKSIDNNGTRVFAPLALIAALALMLALVAGESAEGKQSGASAAKAKAKKCKKKKKSTKAGSAKKKKCKKPSTTTPATPTTPPVVRATLSWVNADSDTGDLDLFVFDASGNKAGNGADTIPNSSISTDVVGKNGTETFTDTAPKPARGLSFGVCFTVGGSQHGAFTLTYVTADGQSHTETRDPGGSTQYEFPGDGVAIPAGYCVH